MGTPPGSPSISTTNIEKLKEQLKTKEQTLQKKQLDFRTWAHRKLSTQDEKASFNCTTIPEAIDFWSTYEQRTKTHHELQAQKGWRRWLGHYRSFAEAASGFLEDFQPFLQFAPDLYTSLAVGTINLFFVLGHRRNDTDGTIGRTINGLKERLPGLKKFEEVYDGRDECQEVLRLRITIAYLDFVDFAIEATRYYLQPGCVRWSRSFFKSKQFGDLADEVQTSFSAVRLDCEDLLSFTVHDVKKGNIELREQNKELRRQNDELLDRVTQLQDEEQRSNLEMLQSCLGLSHWSSDQQTRDLDTHNHDLLRENANDPLGQPMTVDEIDRYEASSQFEEWTQPDQPSMLLIVGENHYAAARRHHCWISTLAIHWIRHHRAVNSDLIFYLFNVEAWTSAWEVMREILFQLILIRRSVLLTHSSRETLVNTIKEFHRLPASVESSIKKRVLERAIMTSLKLLEKDQVIHVVIDRIDRCVERDQVDLLNLLIRMMEEADCVVKVLVVANKRFWDTSKADLRNCHRSSVIEDLVQQRLVA